MLAQELHADAGQGLAGKDKAKHCQAFAFHPEERRAFSRMSGRWAI